MLFLECCDQWRLKELQIKSVFNNACETRSSTFYDGLKSMNIKLTDLQMAVKSRFITLEYTRTLLHEWEAPTLTGNILINKEQSAVDCLEILTGK